MSGVRNVQPSRAAAILEAEELARYQQALTFLQHQMGLVERAKAALQETEFVAQCVESERARLWRELCATHGLDPEKTYTVDAAGRVFEA
jgi:hypothetical protein